MLNIASINIEKSRHLERVAAFLAAQKPDVCLLQEVMEEDIAYLTELCGGYLVWEPMTTELDGRIIGIAVGSRYPLQQVWRDYYFGQPENGLPTIAFLPDGNAPVEIKHYLLLGATVTKADADYPLATTHFVWTKNGASTSEQQALAHKMLALIDPAQPLLLGGDFNAPRGRETWAIFAEKLQDHIPPEVTTSIDGKLHRAGQLNLMVDGLFTTCGYVVNNVQFHTGVSDHQAITALVERVDGVGD